MAARDAVKQAPAIARNHCPNLAKSAPDPRLLRLVRLLAQQAARECYEEELRLAREKKREAPPG